MNDFIQRGIGMTSARTRERLVQRLVSSGIENQSVLNTIRVTPRHLFIDEALAHRAYEDSSLPIGYSQTISQPYMVARMTELLLSRGTPQKVLEIGTGCGYQSAVLSQLVPQVYSVERIEPLLDKSAERLQNLGYKNIRFRLSDGNFGWPENGPYDAILSAAAPYSIPKDLLNQLAPDGILVIPVGGDNSQQLTVAIRKGDSDEFEFSEIEKVRFVPLLSGLGNS